MNEEEIKAERDYYKVGLEQIAFMAGNLSRSFDHAHIGAIKRWAEKLLAHEPIE